jgi:itaconyl-CoA hydratase
MEGVTAFEKIADNRYRETFGLFYEDFQVGATIEHYPGRTITEADNIWMSLLCMNVHPLHIDNHYGQGTEWGKNLVSSLVTLAVVGGLALRGTSARCTANLGWEEISLAAPVFAGDTIYAETEVLEKRLSRSRPNEGIVKVKTRGKKSDGTEFLVFTRSFLVPLREKTNQGNADHSKFTG